MVGIMKAHSTATFRTLLYPQETLICEPTSSSCGCFPCCEIDDGAPGLCLLSAPDSCYDCVVCWPSALLVHLLASCACPPSPSHAGLDDPSPIAGRQKQPKDYFKYQKNENWVIPFTSTNLHALLQQCQTGQNGPLCFVVCNITSLQLHGVTSGWSAHSKFFTPPQNTIH